MKTGPWTTEECWLAVWAYDRLDTQRELQAAPLIQELANHLMRDAHDVEQMVRAVAACDDRPANMKPLKADDQIRGKLRFVFATYWEDRESGRRRAIATMNPDKDLVDEPDEPPPAPAPEDPLDVWRSAIRQIQEDSATATGVADLLRCALKLIQEGKGSPEGIPMDSLLAATRSQCLEGCATPATFQQISHLGLGKVWHAVAPSKSHGRSGKLNSPSGSFAFKSPFTSAFHLRGGTTTLLGLIPTMRPQMAEDRHVLKEALTRLREVETAEAEARRSLPAPSTANMAQVLEGLRPAVGGPGGVFQRCEEGLKRLTALPRQMKELWSAHPLAGESLHPLAQAARELALRTAQLKPPAPPDPEAFQKAMRRWAEAPGDLSRLDRREIRLLCQHAITALNTRWVQALTHPSAPPLRRIWVEGLVGHYLAHWRSMPNAEALERSLKDLLERLQGVQPGSRDLVRECLPLIGPDAPARLVTTLERPLDQWEPTLERLALSREVGFGQAFLGEVFRVWLNGVLMPRGFRGDSEVREEVRFAFQTLLREPALPDTDFRDAVSALVLLPRLETNPEWREMVVEEVLRHPRLGDPRRQTHHWHTIRTARDRVISWMAAKDLRVFYDSVVADHADDQGRKAFWLRYVDRVADFRLVLCEDDKLRLRGVFGPGKGHAADMEGARVSAFILRFHSKRGGEDLICVEFSKTGYSLYAYDASAFEAGIGRMDAISFRVGSEPRNLRNREYCKFRIPHMGAWQNNATDLLKAYGIEPR